MTTTTLAAEINQQHQLAYDKAHEALVHARRAGELLLQAKASLKHGEFLPWLKANVEVSERQAQRYMKLSEGWEQIAKKSDAMADLTITGALRLLEAPELIDATVQARPKSVSDTVLAAVRNDDLKSGSELFQQWLDEVLVDPSPDGFRPIAGQYMQELEDACVRAARRDEAALRDAGLKRFHRRLPPSGRMMMCSGNNAQQRLWIVESAAHPLHYFVTAVTHGDDGEIVEAHGLRKPIASSYVDDAIKALGFEVQGRTITRTKYEPWPCNYFLFDEARCESTS